MALTYTPEQTTAANGNFTSPDRTDDRIVGGNADQNLNAGRGNDRIEAGGGNDTAEGGEGDDYVDGGSGNDLLSGSQGKDLLIGGSGDDIMRYDQTDFVDANGRSVDGGPGLQGRLGQGDIYDGGSGFDLVAVRNAGGNRATDGSAADVAGFDRAFQFSTAGNRDLRNIDGIVVDHSDDKGDTGGFPDASDLVRHSLGEISGNTPIGDSVFVAYLGGGADTLQLTDSASRGWELVDDGADLSATRQTMIASAGRFGSDTGKIDDLLNTYTFEANDGRQVTIYSDAESITLGGADLFASDFVV